MRYSPFLTMIFLAMPASASAHTGTHSITGLLASLWHMLIEHAPMALLTVLIAVVVFAVLRSIDAKKEDSA